MLEDNGVMFMLRAVQFAGADLNWKEGRKMSVYKIHFPQLDQKGRG